MFWFAVIDPVLMLDKSAEKTNVVELDFVILGQLFQNLRTYIISGTRPREIKRDFLFHSL